MTVPNWPEYRNQLDPVFDDVVDQLAGTVGILKFGDAIGDAAPDWIPDWVFTSKPLENYDFYAFFEPAAALSGQKLDEVEAIYDLINEVWSAADDDLESFQSGMAQVLSHWEGKAAVQCAEFVGSLVDYANNQRDVLLQLAEALVAYGAIITEAQNGMAELMRACDDGFAQISQAADRAAASVGITVLTAITGSVVSLATGGAALPAFASAVLTVGGSVATQTVTLSGSDHAGVADEFLTKANEIIGEAGKAVNITVVPALRQAFAALPHTPPVPWRLDEESFHPRSSEARASKASHVAAGPAGPIQQRLEGEV